MKRLLSFILIISILLSISLNILAATEDGSDYDTAITGTSEMTSGYYTYDAYTNYCVITGYNGSESSVVIPSSLGGMTVTGVDGDAFYQNTTLTSVTIPETVEYIGSDCFYGCTSLKTLNLTKGLKSIGAAAFEGCTSLTYLFIPPTVEEILTSAFEGCTGLTQIDLCEGLEIIKSSAFEGCSAVTEIELPGTLRTLGSYAFSKCSSLNRVIIHEGLEVVDRYAFRGCSELPEIVFPESLTEIREYALRNCYALTDVTFLNPETVFDSDDDIFYNCSGFTIHGAEGSTAQTYAETYSMAFEVLGEEESGLIDPGFESAQLLTESGETVPLNFNGEALYYTFEQSEDAEFSVEVTPTSGSSIKYEMYDSAFSLIDEFTTQTNDSFSSFFSALPEGIYYIKVYAASGSTVSGTLFINFAAGETLLSDPGFESAEPILAVKTSYKFSAEGTYCYFAFKPMEQLNVHLNISNRSQGELAWELFDENYSLIYSYVMPKANGMLHTLKVTPGVYYIRFFSTGDHAISGSLSINNDVPLGNPKYIPLQDFQIEESSLELQVGDSYQLTPVFTPVDADCQTISWESNNKSIVTISEDGVITALSEGSAVVAGSVTDSYEGVNSSYIDMVDIIVKAADKPEELTDPGFESAERLYVSGEDNHFELNGTCKYYSFFLIANTSIGVDFRQTSKVPLKMELYDSSHTLVETHSTGGNVTAVGCYGISLSSGMYYIKLSPTEGTVASGNLKVISLAMEPKIQDPGFSSAEVITESDTAYSFEALFEYKYYAFDMADDGIADIYIQNSSSGKLVYDLYQGRNIVLFSHEMRSGANYTYSPELQKGRYYIRLYTPWNHAISGNISVSSAVLEKGTENDDPSEDSGSTLKVYEPTYEYIRPFKDNYATVYNNGVYSLVDAQNNHHYSTNQDGFGDYSEEIVAIYDADKHEITFTRLDGYSFAFIGYIWAGEFLGGKCVIVDEDGKYGLIDASGNFIVDCVYDDIAYDVSDTVLLYSDSVWTPYTIGQDSTYSLNSLSEVTEIYNPVLSVTGGHIIASDGTAYGILTTDNVPLTEFEYDLIHDAEDGLFVGYRGDYVDLIGTDGTVSATLTAYYVGGYSEGKLAVYDGTEFFYVDKNGNRVVELSVEDVVSAEEFHDSLAVICIDNKGYTYINTSGEIAVDSYWDYAAQFAEGYALVMNYITDGDGNMLRRWNVIDMDFNNVLTLEDDVYIDAADEHSADFSNGYIRTVERNTGLMGFIQLESATSGNVAGDVNGDGIVTAKDAKYLLYYLISPEDYQINTDDIDYDGDGEVNRTDALYLLRHTILPERYPLAK